MVLSSFGDQVTVFYNHISMDIDRWEWCSFNIFMWLLHGTKQVPRKNLIHGARTFHAFDEVFWGSEGSAVWRLKLFLICEGQARGLSPYFKRRERESIGENKYSMVKLEDFCTRVRIRFSNEVFGLTILFFLFLYFFSWVFVLCYFLDFSIFLFDINYVIYGVFPLFSSKAWSVSFIVVRLFSWPLVLCAELFLIKSTLKQFKFKFKSSHVFLWWMSRIRFRLYSNFLI